MDASGGIRVARTRDALGATDVLHGLLHGALGDVEGAAEVGAVVRVVRRRDHEVLDGHKVVPPHRLERLRRGDHGLEVAAEDLVGGAGDLGLAAEVAVDVREHCRRVGLALLEDAAREAVGLLEQRRDEVLGLYCLVGVLFGDLRTKRGASRIGVALPPRAGCERRRRGARCGGNGVEGKFREASGRRCG